MLGDMQGQWLANAAKGCAQARVGLAMWSAHQGKLSPAILVRVMGFAFRGTHHTAQIHKNIRRVIDAPINTPRNRKYTPRN
jgi:hypothetical protein